MTFHIDIVSLKGKIYSGEAKEIILPGIDGELTILGNHEALVTPLNVGEVVVSTANGVKNLSIGKGVFSINKNKAQLLIEDVTDSDEISEQKAQEAVRKAEELIKKGIPDAEQGVAHYTYRKSLIDLRIARKKRKLNII
jgi:F-type H+-transporting ATPase subunit epsilon